MMLQLLSLFDSYNVQMSLAKTLVILDDRMIYVLRNEGTNFNLSRYMGSVADKVQTLWC